MNVHESLSDWRSLPMSMLDGHRAIIQLNEGTIIDGYLRYVPSKTPQGITRRDGRNLRIIDG